MKVDLRFGLVGAAALVAAGAAGAVIAMSGHHTAGTPIVVRQDAALITTSATHAKPVVTPSASPAKPKAVVVKKPAAVQETTPVTDPTDAPTAAAPVETSATPADSQPATNNTAVSTEGPGGGPLPSMAPVVPPSPVVPLPPAPIVSSSHT